MTFAIASLVLRFQVRAKTQQLQAEVSERKRAEEILYKSEERGRLFMDSATDAFSIWDSELNLVDCNEVRMKMYFPGLRKEEVIGKNIKELHPHFWGTDRYKDFLAVMKTGKPLFIADAVYSEDSFSRPESEQRHIVVQAFKVGDGLGVINTDITERKKAEEEIEKLAKFPSENPNPVLRVAKDGSILYTNDAGLSLLDVWGCNQGQPLPDKWRKFISSVLDSGSIKDTEVEVNDRLLSLSFIPVADTDYVNVYGLDITERVQAEKEKAQMEQQFSQMQKLESIGRLTGGVAHDLNNMLTPILGFGEMLLEKSAGDEESREQLEEIVKAARRARDLVRQLLAFSRKQTLEFKNIDLNTLIKDFEKLLRSTIREDIVIKLIPAKSLPLIHGDVGQLEQVVMNLVVNAQDAMPDGGELTIETDLVELDERYAAEHTSVIPGPHVLLVVSDTGCGMDEEIREHIFEPFFTTKGKGRGTGLGLSTVYGIVKQHGGNIWVYSEPGKGTTFKVYLPLSRETQAEQKTERITPTAPRGSETILLAEDDDIVRKLAMTILEQSGYTVLTAKNGIDALQVLKMYDGPVHMLLTDVVMPEMNGKELFNLAVKKLPDLKVLYMSGYTDSVIANSGVLDEGIAFIQKPFTVHDLAAKVREVLD